MASELKIKILKILPFWLCGLVLVCSAQGTIGLLEKNGQLNQPNHAQAAESIQPEVLGESTSIRGAQIESEQNKIIESIKEPQTNSISAKSFLAFDLDTGQNLLVKNPSSKLSIASLTKLITGLTAYHNSDLNLDVIITPKDTLDIKPNLDFIVGDKIKALDVFNAMLVGSCNDAALALADYVASSTGKSFVNLMNSEAATLGMRNSNFSNPMGFDSQNNYSTADDIKTLIIATEKLAAFKNLGRRTDYSFVSSLGHNYSTVATNKLIKNHSDIEAIKTGFTLGAQGAMATKISVSNHEIVILVLGSQDREADTLKLRDEILNDFKW